VLAGPLDSLSPADRATVNEVLMAMLSSVLRAWIGGTITVDEARARMARTVRLIFSPPPVEQSSA
jgi:hypothetical protein